MACYAEVMSAYKSKAEKSLAGLLKQRTSLDGSERKAPMDGENYTTGYIGADGEAGYDG